MICIFGAYYIWYRGFGEAAKEYLAERRDVCIFFSNYLGMSCKEVNPFSLSRMCLLMLVLITLLLSRSESPTLHK
jgi:hypothetical protein